MKDIFIKIIDEIKNKSPSIHRIIISILICFLIVKFWNLVVLIGETLLKSIISLLPHMVSVLVIIIILITIKYFFKLSDEKSQKRIDVYSEPLIIKSEGRKYISVNLIERYGQLNGTYGKILEVIIKNEVDNNIDYVKGYISLYEKRTRISKIYFEFDNLKKAFNERIFYNFITYEMEFWDSFDIYIYEVQIEDKIDKNFRIEGNYFIRTYFLELNPNKFYDFRVFGIKTKYNLIWFKEKFREKILFRIRYLHIPLIMLIMFVTSFFMLFILIDTGKAIIDLYNIWRDCFEQMVNII